jgi:hypothetical protein
MPKLRVQTAQRNRALTFNEKFCLSAGCFIPDGCYGGPGYCSGTMAQHRQRWTEHKDELIEWDVDRFPGSRPEAFWHFKPGIPDELRSVDRHYSSHDEYDQLERERAAWLVERGLIDGAEIARGR